MFRGPIVPYFIVDNIICQIVDSIVDNEGGVYICHDGTKTHAFRVLAVNSMVDHNDACLDDRRRVTHMTHDEFYMIKIMHA